MRYTSGMAMLRRLVLLLTASVCVPAQDPTFRANSRLVQVNVIVHGKNGPVFTLTKDDFVLKDRGKQQPIGVFAMDSRESAKTTASPLPPNTFSNQQTPEGGSGSVTIILLDRLNTLSSAGVENYEASLTWHDDHALAFAKQKLIQS